MSVGNAIKEQGREKRRTGEGEVEIIELAKGTVSQTRILSCTNSLEEKKKQLIFGQER